jgi:hypothetical protein
MKTIAMHIAVLLIAVGTAAAASAQERAHKPYHKDLAGQCALCHGAQSPKSVTRLLCTDCHGSPEDMARKTAALNLRNPHTSIHFGTSLPCEECHKEHRAAYNYCTESCHRTWPNRIPGAPK